MPDPTELNTVRAGRIEDAIDDWHRGAGIPDEDLPLHAYLGWTWLEYARWVETNEPPAPRQGSV